jgi:predicted amidohydrolase YtcJ
MLIRNAEIFCEAGALRRVDLRISDGLIEALGPRLQRRQAEFVFDAMGGLLLPGLHDQHLHLRALAAEQASVRCGPPEVLCETALSVGLHSASASLAPGEWLRGTGYHESVAGLIDRDWLDRHGPARPIRMQHRGGRCWFFNSRALHEIGVDPDRLDDNPLERIGGRATGRLFDADDWLRKRLPRRPHSLAAISQKLARFGVTTVTDATPRNDIDEFHAIAAAQTSGELLQDAILLGDASLDTRQSAVTAQGARLACGATKFHLHDADLPDFDEIVQQLQRSHHAQRPAAFHCVTRGELAFALAAFAEAGTVGGDRIEHASVTPPELFEDIARLGLRVTVQPNFVAERGDAYLDNVDPEDRPWLYRLASFFERGIAVSGSTDAPFGNADPWAAMRAAVFRRTPDARVLGADEALTAAQALGLFCALGNNNIRAGAVADMCLLDRPWSAAKCRLVADDLRLTLKNGAIVWNRESAEACIADRAESALHSLLRAHRFG